MTIEVLSGLDIRFATTGYLIDAAANEHPMALTVDGNY
jgi:hypothetical protein